MLLWQSNIFQIGKHTSNKLSIGQVRVFDFCDAVQQTACENIQALTGLYANNSVEEQKVKDIMEMGFTSQQARKALDACGMDKQAAIEHILTNL